MTERLDNGVLISEMNKKMFIMKSVVGPASRPKQSLLKCQKGDLIGIYLSWTHFCLQNCHRRPLLPQIMYKVGKENANGPAQKAKNVHWMGIFGPLPRRRMWFGFPSYYRVWDVDILLPTPQLKKLKLFQCTSRKIIAIVLFFGRKDPLFLWLISWNMRRL